MSKIKLQQCKVCNDETVHDVGMKQAHKADSHYTRRSTMRCRVCGTKEINNRIKGRRVISGTNEIGD